MRGGPAFVVLLASVLAIDIEERDGLGALGPARANLRGLKFGHSVTDVTESGTDATDPPAPAPTSVPAQSPTFEGPQD